MQLNGFKSYIHKSEPVLVNKTHKIVGRFEIKTDLLISARRPDLVMNKKKKKKRTCRQAGFAVPADNNKRKRRERERERERERACVYVADESIWLQFTFVRFKKRSHLADIKVIRKS